MNHKHRRRFAFALVMCLLFGLLPGTTRAEQTQTAPVADTPAAETPETAVPAIEMPTPDSEPIEAEPVSLSENEVRVIKGQTTTLTAEIPEDQRGGSSGPFSAASGIIWTSSNPAVATVDSNGIVTGIELGEATITATLNGTVLETYTTYITLANGFYVFETVSSSHFLCPTAISMADDTTMYSMETELYSSQELSTFAELGRKWYIKHLEGTYYSIHPAFSSEMVLCIGENMQPVLRKVSSLNDNSWHWRIVSGTLYYVLLNRAYQNRAAVFEDPESSGSPLIGVTRDPDDSDDGSQDWCILSAFSPPYGLLLFDQCSGNLLKYDLPSETAVLDTVDDDGYAAKGLSFTPAELGLYIQPLNRAEPLVSISFSSGIASFNSGTQKITGNQTGTTTATISKVIGGSTYVLTLTFVVKETEQVTVKYDYAYASRYPDYLSRINLQTQALAQKYRTDFHIFLNIGTPTLFQSYGDTCSNSSHDSNCNCASDDACQNVTDDFTPNIFAPILHHKNVNNIFHSSQLPDQSKRLNFIGHYVCYVDLNNFNNRHHVSGSYDENGKLHYVYGMANYKKKLAQAHDHTTLAHEISTVVHELGHLFGAPDHYTGAPNGWTVEQLNALPVVAGRSLFSNYCLYGNQKSDASVVNNLTVCPGCTKVIRGEIELPEKPPENDEGA